MKKFILVILGCLAFLPAVNAQPEVSTVDVKARFARSNSFTLSAGPAFVQGALGDYSTGLSFQGGYMKRMNKLLSLGLNLSYLGFAYDAEKTYKYYYNDLVFVTSELTLTGGDVELLSLGLNIKINLIPVSDDTKFSVYGIATPFVSSVTRGEVSGSALQYTDDNNDLIYDDYFNTDDWDASTFPTLAEESTITGGIYLGFGIEFLPVQPVSFFAQASYGYTFPITFVSTSSFLHDTDKRYDANDRLYYRDNNTRDQSYYNSEFPIIEEGFSALSICLGVSFNF